MPRFHLKFRFTKPTYPTALLLHHIQSRNLHILRPGQRTALFLGVLDIIHNIRSDSFAGGKNRDSRRIAHDKLTANFAYALFQRHSLFVRIKRLLHAKCHVRRQVFALQHTGRVTAVQPLDFRQRRYQPFDLQRPVSGSDNGKDIADVAKLNLNAIFIPEQVIHFDACQTRVSGMDRQFCPVEGIKRITVAQFIPVNIIAANTVDLFSCIIYILHRFPIHLSAIQRQISSRNIQGNHEQVRGTR